MKKLFEKIKSFLKIKLARRIAIFLAIFSAIVLVECTAFNYRSYQDRGAKQDIVASEVTIARSTLTTEKSKDNKNIYTMNTKDYPVFTIDFDKQTEVNTIYFDINFDNVEAYRYMFEVSGTYHEETRVGSTYSSANLEIIYGDEHTKYFVTDFNHPVEKVTIRMLNVGNYGSGTELKYSFGGVGINHKVPFHFSWARVILLLGAASILYFPICLFRDRKEQTGKPWKKIALEALMYIIPIAIVVGLFALFGHFENAFCNKDYGTQISKELVDAFMKGHVYLDEKPSEALMALSNPYDPNMRGGVSYLWDHLFYNGKYYSYYGITPVFLLFLPFRLIFGQYLYDAYGVLLFTVIGVFFMTMTYNRTLKILFKDKPLPLAIKYTLYGLLFLGSGCLFNLTRPYFYEVSTSSAYMCMMIMLYHLVSGGILFKNEDKKYFTYHLVFASLWGALAVLARATMALYAVCHVIYLGFYFFKNYKEMKKKDMILFFVCSLTPYVILGGVQCIYNYLRFGSFFDFGIEYSLTIADFKNMPFHFGNVLTSLYNFLFGLPIPTANSYFMYGANVHFGGAYYFFETSSSVGLFIRMPILWLIFILPFMNKATAKERLEHLVLRWLPCVIIPFIQVAITWQSGYATRYFSDFAWPLTFFAVLLIAKQYQQSENEKVHKGIFAFLVGNLLFSSFVTICVIFVYVPMLTHHAGAVDWAYTRFYYHLGHELNFWR